jgi:broad specificity phosphatase PhoE
MYTSVILVRHAQSEKNIKDIHGGDGEKLTSLGLKQAYSLANVLRSWNINRDNSIITYAPNVQTAETADILSKRLNCTAKKMSAFIPLYFGVVHGLSDQEMKTKYPDVFLLLSQWRNKEMEICDLDIPKMESPLAFYKRGQEILNNIQNDKHNIFIATNSLFILLLNILLGHTCEHGGGYKHHSIENCDIAFFETMDNKTFLMRPEYTTVCI